MPTDFDWGKLREARSKETIPEEPKYTINFGLILFIVFTGIISWGFINEATETLKVVDYCNELHGVPIRTLRGDTVCIKQDVLTDVLNRADLKK